MNAKSLVYERCKHFVGEQIKTRKGMVQVIDIYRHFVRVSNGHYTWCIDYFDLLVGGDKHENVS